MYDPSKFAFSWGGVAARGFQDGEMINWTFPNDEFSAYSGTRGEGTLVKNPDKRCNITVTLQANSPTNAAWAALYDAGVPLPAMTRDRSSSAAVAFAEQAMPTKRPDLIRGRDNPTVTWVFAAVNGTAEHIGDV